MWPFTRIKHYPDNFVIDMHQSIVSTWTEEFLIRTLENDEDASRRFLFSSYIQAMIFYFPSELDSTTAIVSERGAQAITTLGYLFLGARDEVLIKDYIGRGEEWELPKYLEMYCGIKCDPSNCLEMHLPLAHLLLAVFRMRLDSQISYMSSDREAFAGSYYDYSVSMGMPASQRVHLAGVEMANHVYVGDLWATSYSGEYIADLVNARTKIFTVHSRDLMEAVVTTIQKYG